MIESVARSGHHAHDDNADGIAWVFRDLRRSLDRAIDLDGTSGEP